MADLSTVSTDDLVAEVQNRLTAGVLGYSGLYSRNQLDYCGAWWALCSYVHELRGKWPNELVPKLMWDKITELARTKTEAPGVFAVNTTFHGVAARQDHAPQ